MRYPSSFHRRDSTLDVAMTPMIDVVFMLLIFFVWTASFHVSELILPSSLVTQSEGSQPVDERFEDLERVVVRLAHDATSPALLWFVNDVPIDSLDGVRERLKLVASINAELPVLVDPAASIALGDVIDVYDAAKLSGFKNVQFATPAE